MRGEAAAIPADVEEQSHMSEWFMAPGGAAAISVLWTAALVGRDNTGAEAERVSSGDGFTDVRKGCLRAL